MRMCGQYGVICALERIYEEEITKEVREADRRKGVVGDTQRVRGEWGREKKRASTSFTIYYVYCDGKIGKEIVPFMKGIYEVL